MSSAGRPTLEVYRRYPLANVLIYHGTTIAHFTIGAWGLLLGYGRWPVLAHILAAAYLVFAFGQMYVLMPLVVCPSCVYVRMRGARCVMGLNSVVARILPLAGEERFARRAEGLLCHNHLYMAALAAPLVLMLPGLVVHFSVGLLFAFAAVIALLAVRITVVFPRVACGHCAARAKCPNARAMGLS